MGVVWTVKPIVDRLVEEFSGQIDIVDLELLNLSPSNLLGSVKSKDAGESPDATTTRVCSGLLTCSSSGISTIVKSIFRLSHNRFISEMYDKTSAKRSSNGRNPMANVCDLVALLPTKMMPLFSSSAK